MGKCPACIIRAAQQMPAVACHNQETGKDVGPVPSQWVKVAGPQLRRRIKAHTSRRIPGT